MRIRIFFLRFVVEVALTTLMPGWRQVLQYRGISPKHKVTNKQINNKKERNIMKILTTVIPLSNRGVMARASGAEVPGKTTSEL